VPRHHECGIKAINDIKFSKNGALIAVASTDKNIYLLQFQDNDYVALAACRLENGFPVSINFSEDSSKIVICTNQRKLLLLDPATFSSYSKLRKSHNVFGHLLWEDIL
jgi:WD40 repeat protein